MGRAWSVMGCGGSTGGAVPFEVDCSAGLTLVDQVEAGVRAAIAGGFWRVGDRLPTRAEFVAALGVSKNVVHAALARLIAEGLVCSHTSRGCVVTRTERRAVVRRVLGVQGENDGVYAASKSFEGMSHAFRSAGIAFDRVPVCHDGRRADYSPLMSHLDRVPDLVIVDASKVSLAGVLNRLESRGVPYVVAYTPMPRGRRHCLANVRYDSRAAVAELVRDCRRARIASVCLVGFDVRELDRYESAFAAAGLSTERLAVPLDCVFSDLEGMERAANALMRRRLDAGPLPELVYFADDHLFRGGLTALLERGVRIPRDVSVVSLMNRGDGPVLSRSIAAIRFDPRAYGERIARMALQWLKTGRISSELCLSPEYVRGETFPVRG